MPRKTRRAANQALFRQVNERIAEISRQFEDRKDGSPQAFFCECSLPGCDEMLDVPVALYERIRTESSHYLVRREHRDPARETVLENVGGDGLIVGVSDD